MLSATSTTIKKHYNVLGFLKMGMYPISKKGFKTYHTFSIPTPTKGKKKRNQPKKTSNQTTLPIQFMQRNTIAPCWASQSFCIALPKTDLCSKWPVRKQTKRNGKHRDKSFSLSSGNHFIHFL